MKLMLGYNYKSVCGIFKIGVYFESKDEKTAVLELVFNDRIYPLKFSADYLLLANKVWFGVNTYHGSEYSEFLIKLQLLVNGVSEHKIEIACKNDPLIHNSIALEMKRIPALVPLPFSTKIFETLGCQKLNFEGKKTADQKIFDFQGYIVKNSLINLDFIDNLAAELDKKCAESYQGYVEGSSQRLQHLHMSGGAVSKLFADRKLRKFLQLLFGVEMLPCQTLGYRYGSQQEVHSDFIHLTAYPKNLMCGVWIALEDIQDGSGELAVWPGSHCEKELTMESFNLQKVVNNDYSLLEPIVKIWKEIASNYKETKLNLKKGNVVVWQANLLHGGSPRTSAELTRKSIVLHFFGRGAACYYDSTGEIGFSGEQLQHSD